MQDELDDLFAPAFAQIRADRHEALQRSLQPKRFKSKDAEAPPPDDRYLRPEMWERGRGVALIHTESQTLLGNFIEWVHKTDSSAKKLVRTEEPIKIDATEQIDEAWWLDESFEISPPEAWHEKRPAVLDLTLAKLSVHCPACPLIVHLSYGAIARVELEFATTFAAMTGWPEQLVQLPAGVNVLPMMGQDAKVALRAEVA